MRIRVTTQDNLEPHPWEVKRVVISQFRAMGDALVEAARGTFRNAPLKSKPVMGRLTNRTGNLASSIDYDIDDTNLVLTFGAGQRNIPRTFHYAHVHELGGTYRGRVYPRRPYMQPATEAVLPEYGVDLSTALLQVWEPEIGAYRGHAR
jgi:hypothetical protein